MYKKYQLHVFENWMVAFFLSIKYGFRTDRPQKF